MRRVIIGIVARGLGQGILLAERFEVVARFLQFAPERNPFRRTLLECSLEPIELGARVPQKLISTIADDMPGMPTQRGASLRANFFIAEGSEAMPVIHQNGSMHGPPTSSI